MSQKADIASARDSTLEGGLLRTDVSSLPPNKDVCEHASDLLGMSAALSLLPELYPEGWNRYPELAGRICVLPNDRRLRAGTRRSGVVGLFKDVSGEPNWAAAAKLIVELIGALPEAEQEQCRPVPRPHPTSSSAPQEKAQNDKSPATVGDDGSPSLPRIEDAADLVAEKSPDPPEVVCGVLHQGSKMILAGSSKAYKTWLLVGLALSVAYGLEWLGFATRQGLVLYLNLEIQGAFFARRIRTVAGAKGVTIEPGRLSVLNLRGHAADLSKLLPALLARICAGRYTLIIVDPIYKLFGDRDENNAGQIAGLLNDLERLAVETGAAVVFAAHYSKGNQAGKAAMDRTSGSGVFARDPDTILALTPHEEADAFTVEATLRNHPPIAPFVVRWKHPLMERDGELNPRKLKQVAGRPKSHTPEDLLKVLGDRELSYSVWKTGASKVGITETTFKALRKELKDSGQVCQSEETGAYRRAGKGEKGF